LVLCSPLTPILSSRSLLSIQQIRDFRKISREGGRTMCCTGAVEVLRAYRPNWRPGKHCRSPFPTQRRSVAATACPRVESVCLLHRRGFESTESAIRSLQTVSARLRSP
jgi:hypothetical protein